MLCFSLSVICCLFLDELVANVQARCKAFINPHNVSSQILSTNSKTTIFGQQHPNFVYYTDITYQSNFLNIRLYLIESIFIRILNGWNDYTISSIESFFVSMICIITLINNFITLVNGWCERFYNSYLRLAKCCFLF